MPNLHPSERFVPFTPAGSCLMDLAAPTEELAWKRLMKAAAHMPYPDKEAFIKRGYTVEDSETWKEVVRGEDSATEEVGQGVRGATGAGGQARGAQRGPQETHGRRRRTQGRR